MGYRCHLPYTDLGILLPYSQHPYHWIPHVWDVCGMFEVQFHFQSPVPVRRSVHTYNSRWDLPKVLVYCTWWCAVSASNLHYGRYALHCHIVATVGCSTRQRSSLSGGLTKGFYRCDCASVRIQTTKYILIKVLKPREQGTYGEIVQILR